MIFSCKIVLFVVENVQKKTLVAIVYSQNNME